MSVCGCHLMLCAHSPSTAFPPRSPPLVDSIAVVAIRAKWQINARLLFLLQSLPLRLPLPLPLPLLLSLAFRFAWLPLHLAIVPHRFSKQSAAPLGGQNCISVRMFMTIHVPKEMHTHTHRRALCIMSSYGGALLSAKHYLKHESKVFSKVFRFEEVIREI